MIKSSAGMPAERLVVSVLAHACASRFHSPCALSFNGNKGNTDENENLEKRERSFSRSGNLMRRAPSRQSNCESP
jgi:hypothetical protein